MEFLGYVATIFMGLSLGLLGGGGSILSVPILVYLFQLEASVATAYSLFLVGATALAGGISYFKRNEVNFKIGFFFALPSFFSVYWVRSWLMPRIPDTIWGEITKDHLVLGVFSVLMIAASVSMIKKSKPQGSSPMQGAKLILSVVLEGLVVGALTGFVGAGGGFLILPALVAWVGLPMKVAIGTSLFIIASKSAVGFMGDLQNLTQVDWRLLLSLLSISLLGLIVGVQLSKYVSDQKLKTGFGYFVLILGTFILAQQI